VNALVDNKRSPLQLIKSPTVRPLTAADLRSTGSHALTNQLYSTSGVHSAGLIWYWEAITPTRTLEWIRLAADDARMLIAVDGDAVGLDSQPFDWRSYMGDTRLLGWTAHHEPIIELMRAVFTRDWLPDDFGDDDAARRRSNVRAGFSIHRIDGLRVASGVTSFDASFIPKLTAARGTVVQRVDSSAHRASAQMHIVIDEFDMLPAELNELEPGCVVRLDNSTLGSRTPRIMLRAGGTRLLADACGDQATFVGHAAASIAPEPSIQANTRGSNMSDANRTQELTAGTPANVAGNVVASDPGIDIGSIPVRVNFSAGRVMLAFETLRKIAPGYVFELNKRLDDSIITIHANDAPIAYGELVVIGDLVGVRVTRMLAAG
jgi:flagellar motor switch/type III secretory pathway protein FliN